jgi:hypothetical protein
VDDDVAALDHARARVIGEIQGDRHASMCFCKGVHHRRHMKPAKAVGGDNSQMPADGLLAIGQCLGERLHRLGDDRPVRGHEGAFISQGHPATGTVDQPNADAFLQRSQALGDGRRGDVHLSGGFGQRHRLGQHIEEAKILRADHSVRP